MPPDADDAPPLTPEVAAALIGAPAGDVGATERVEHWRSETWTVTLTDGRRYVVKTFPGVDGDQVRKEANVYRRLAAESEVPVPEVVAVDADAERGPWPSLVTAYVEGRGVDDLDALVPGEREHLLRELGGAYGEMHATVGFDRFGLIGPTARTPFEGTSEETWRAWFERPLDGRLDGLSGAFADLEPRARGFVDDRRDALDGSFDPVLLHGDYGLDDVLVAPGEPSVRALLDFERAVAGPAEYGVVRAERALVGDGGSAALRTAFREGYADRHPLPEGSAFERRRDLYRLAALLEDVGRFSRLRGRMDEEEAKHRAGRLRERFATMVGE